jgi:hypothetical protein
MKAVGQESESGYVVGAPRCPGIAEVRSWLDWRVDDVNGSTVGEVDTIRRDRNGRPLWLVVAEFGVGSRRFAVPAADAVGDGDCGRVWSPYPRERIRATHKIVAAGFTVEADRLLLGHYGDRAGAIGPERAA